MTLRNKLFALAMLGLILISCNFPLIRGQVQPTAVKLSDADRLATAVAGTVQALSVPTQAPQATAIPPTAAPQMPTLPPTPAYTVSVVQPTTSTQACNQAEFVSETIPDKTAFSAGESFTKTWTFKNTGTCTWNTNYKLAFASGTSMDAPAAVNLTKSVAPGGTVTVSVDMKAPKTAGTYKGLWSLVNDSSSVFYSNNSVVIVVSTDAFRVSAVTTDLESHEPSSCPYTVNYSLDFTTTGAGKVTYYVSDSNGDTGDTDSLTFAEAGTKGVDLTWKITESGSYWIKVYVDTPNNQEFGPFKFKITCP